MQCSIGGSRFDQGRGIAVDAGGNAYVVGLTFSFDFPTTLGAFQTTNHSDQFNVFVTKLNPTGSGLVYSTYLGGGEFDYGNDIAVDSSGSAYVGGSTFSGDFPTTPGAFEGNTGSGDAFVTKFNPTGTSLVYSTRLGGSSEDLANAVAVDSSDNAYVTGSTPSTDFPTTPGAYQTSWAGGSGPLPSDAFVTKLNPTGSGLVYSTYLGGSDNDGGTAIATDVLGNAYVVGTTSSTNFPTTIGAFQTSFGGGPADAFVTKLNPTGSGLVYSTYLGGSGDDEAGQVNAGTGGIAVDTVGNAFVTGFTNSTNFPTVNPVQASLSGGTDAFVTAVNPLGTGLPYSSYLGGSGNDSGAGIALDSLPNPNAYISGTTSSTNFPTTSGAFQTTYGGGTSDAFVTKIANITLPPPPTVGKVTGGGTINVTGGIGTFGFIVQAQSTSGPISGNLQYHNHASGAKVTSVTFTSLVIAGNTATFGGTCTNNGVPCTFSVMVQDNGEPGSNDSFTISINAGPPEGGTLRSGNIQIHKQ